MELALNILQSLSRIEQRGNINNFCLNLLPDDTNTHFAEKKFESFWNSIVNTELCKLYGWLTSNKLTLNISKSNLVIFHPKQKKPKNYYKPEICLFDNKRNEYVTLESKEYIKYLGILINKNLTCKHHIDTVCLKINKRVALLAKLCHFVPWQILLKIYQSLIYQYITYGLAAGPSKKVISHKIYCHKKQLFG